MLSLQSAIDMTPMVIAAAFAIAAAWMDYKERRISNRLVVAGIVAALLSQTLLHGVAGSGAALAGGALGLALMLPFYIIGGMGAGDVKLMAMVGVGLGPAGVFSAAVLTFLIGGLLAVVLAIAKGTLVRMLSNVRAMLFGAFATMVIQRKAEVSAPAVSAGRLPYGVAIALGTSVHVALLQSGIRVI
jgi:prepilin peptidase CpaA